MSDTNTCAWLSPNDIPCPHEGTLAFAISVVDDIPVNYVTTCSEHLGVLVEKTLSLAKRDTQTLVVAKAEAWT